MFLRQTWAHLMSGYDPFGQSQWMEEVLIQVEKIWCKNTPSVNIFH